jgi:hypothetical protein
LRLQLFPLWSAAAILDKVGISGRTLAALMLQPGNALLVATPDGATLPQLLGGGTTLQMQLRPPDVVIADGVVYRNATVRWPETVQALITAGCRGADRLPLNPEWLDLGTGQTYAIEEIRPARGWWRSATGARDIPERSDHPMASGPIPAAKGEGLEQTNAQTNSETKLLTATEFVDDYIRARLAARLDYSGRGAIALRNSRNLQGQPGFGNKALTDLVVNARVSAGCKPNRGGFGSKG